MKGVFLCLPGLNLHPDSFAPWQALLRAQGYAVVSPPLTGYRAAEDPGWRNTGAEIWLADLDRALLAVREELPTVPLCFLGYSLGGLLGLVWAASRGQPVSRALLLSPALRLRAHLALVLSVLSQVLPERLCIPGRMPARYRMHRCTSVAAYRGLRTLQRRYASFARRAPTIGPASLYVAYAPGDELVDVRSAEALANRLSGRVTLHRLTHRPRSGYLRHLGVDSYTLGDAEWARLVGGVEAWLSSPPAGPVR